MFPNPREVHLTDFEREVFCYAKGHFKGAKGRDLFELKQILAKVADMHPAEYSDKDVFNILIDSVRKAFKFDVQAGSSEEYSFARMAEAIRKNTVASLCDYIASTGATDPHGKKLYWLFSNVTERIKF